MTVVVRLDHHTIIVEVDIANTIVQTDELSTSVEFHSYLPNVPTVTVLLLMDRRETLNLLTKLTRPDLTPHIKRPQ